MMTDITKTIISIFSVLLIAILCFGGLTIHYLKDSNREDSVSARKEDLIAEQRRLAQLSIELNKTIQAERVRQESLTQKLEEMGADQKVIQAQKAQVEELNSAKLSPLPQSIKNTTPVTVTAPRTRAS